MNRQPALTLAFLVHAPDSAAQVLEQLDVQEAASFIEEIPARHASITIGRMSSWSAARCLELVEEHRAAAILRGLPFHDSVGLLRLIDAERHAAILGELPAGRARRLQNALRYPAGSVGAWIDPDVPTFATDATAGEAAKYLRQSDGVSHIFLHDPGSGKFAGAIPAISVLRRHAGTRLEELPTAPVVPLSSRSSLASAAMHEKWDDFLVLPVIGRSRVLVGGLSRASFRKGLMERRITRQIVSRSVLGQLVMAFGITCNGLLRLLTQSSSTPPAWQEDQRNG